MPSSPLSDAFGVAERDIADLDIIKFMAANGIPFHSLRSPQFPNMIRSIKRTPKDYKGPSYEKSRTTLLDACKRSVENDLAEVKIHGKFLLSKSSIAIRIALLLFFIF